MHLVIVPIIGDGITKTGKFDDIDEVAFRPDIGDRTWRSWKRATDVLAEKGYVAVWIDEDVDAFDKRFAGRDDVKILYRDAKGDVEFPQEAVALVAAIDETRADDLPVQEPLSTRLSVAKQANATVIAATADISVTVKS